MSTRRTATPHDRLQALARYADIFTAPGFVFATWHHPPPDASGVLDLPYSILSQEASAFVKDVHEFGWVSPVDWLGWRGSEEGAGFLANPERVATATEDQLAKLLTVFIRGERFCEGTLDAAFNKGFITAIVKQADELLKL